MKKLLFLFVLTVSPALVHAQTASDLMVAHNDRLCDSVGLFSGCTDAAFATAFCATATDPSACAAGRTAEQKVYTTAATYVNSVLVPKVAPDQIAARDSRIVERIVRVYMADASKRAAICTAAGIPSAICK